ncbi:hypothetical protein CBR_g30340 [Chara braunii]|uniref:holo-[acyl-carrier-protein] synthase n=1 Tax=Chara braunii TaxID=69332 RepID=A0A388JX66_CHABU|nr:hypothetical protein CBR_g30340 [Chara braunii]|eukprot:GBG62386.1 hypothetical protein CBR_g30340 [Chara braunii]
MKALGVARLAPLRANSATASYLEHVVKWRSRVESRAGMRGGGQRTRSYDRPLHYPFPKPSRFSFQSRFLSHLGLSGLSHLGLSALSHLGPITFFVPVTFFKLKSHLGLSGFDRQRTILWQAVACKGMAGFQPEAAADKPDGNHPEAAARSEPSAEGKPQLRLPYDAQDHVSEPGPESCPNQSRTWFRDGNQVSEASAGRSTECSGSASESSSANNVTIDTCRAEVAPRGQKWNMSVRAFDSGIRSSLDSSFLLPPPPPSEVDLWCVFPQDVDAGFDELVEIYDDVITAEEKKKIYATVSLQGRKQRLLARVLVRTTLARYCDGRLNPGADTLKTKLELWRRRDPLAVARRYYAPAEVRALEIIPDEAKRQRWFMELWTLKESFVKALGLGIAAVPLKEFSFCRDEDEANKSEEISMAQVQP